MDCLSREAGSRSWKRFGRWRRDRALDLATVFFFFANSLPCSLGRPGRRSRSSAESEEGGSCEAKQAGKAEMFCDLSVATLLSGRRRPAGLFVRRPIALAVAAARYSTFSQVPHCKQTVRKERKEGETKKRYRKEKEIVVISGARRRDKCSEIALGEIIDVRDRT